MDTRIAIAAFELVQDGLSVSEVCRRLAISRDTYYRYRRRFAREGLPGLMPRSTAPVTSANTTPPEMVELICTTQDELVTEGWDAGARSIRYRLLAHKVPGVPSDRTVHRVLTRQGRVSISPAKRAPVLLPPVRVPRPERVLAAGRARDGAAEHRGTGVRAARDR